VASSLLGAAEPGMARVNVLQELGRPVSAIARGNTEVLTYKDGVRITLKDGRVTEITGAPAAAAAPATPAAGPDTGAATAPAPAEPAPPAEAEPAEPVLTKEQVAEQARLEKQWAEEEAKSRAALEKSLIDLENMHGQPPPMPGPPEFNLLEFLIGLVLKWLLTLAALKLTCKYWGVEVFWSGLMTVALVDVLVRAAVGLVGLLLLQMPSVFYADEAVGAIAMVVVLRKVSINQSLAQAVQITMTTKVFSVVVGSFLFVVLLSLLH